jgi:hypothetical protein
VLEGNFSTFFVAQEMRSEEKLPIMENQRLVSTSRQCSITPAGFDQELLNKTQCDNTEESSPAPCPDLATAISCLFPHLEVDLNGPRFCDAN